MFLAVFSLCSLEFGEVFACIFGCDLGRLGGLMAEDIHSSLKGRQPLAVTTLIPGALQSEAST